MYPHDEALISFIAHVRVKRQRYVVMSAEPTPHSNIDTSIMGPVNQELKLPARSYNGSRNLAEQ